MSIHVTRKGDIVVIGVEGQLVAGNRQQLKQAVGEELEAGSRRFLIDFADTGYVDSAGLGVLVSLSKKIREAEGELRLTNLSDDLRTLFELTRLDTLFELGTGGGSAAAARPPSSEPGVAGERRRDDDARPS
jgi:anti-sigma B factor antagonist